MGGVAIQRQAQVEMDQVVAMDAVAAVAAEVADCKSLQTETEGRNIQI